MTDTEAEAAEERDPYDPANFRVTDEQIAALYVRQKAAKLELGTKVETPAAQRRQARREFGFIMVPLVWADCLSKAAHRATLFVALRLLNLAWARKANTVTLSNSGLDEWGVSQREKWRALAELETLGLVAIERARGKSPRVTLLQPRTYRFQA